MASSKERSSTEPPFTEYDGIKFPAVITKENLEAMKTFEMRDGDVVVASYPKSGTNWIYNVVHEILGGKEETLSPRILEICSPGEQPFHVQLRESSSPRLIWTHLPFHLAPPGLADPHTKVKVIVILRNPKDVCVSAYHFNQKNPLVEAPESWEQFTTDFLAGSQFLGDHLDHVLGWWRMRDDPHFLFVKYEDMKKDFLSSVKTLAAFLQKDLTDEDLARVLTNCSVGSMKKTYTETPAEETLSSSLRKLIVRKGVVGDWKNHFSVEESEKFDRKYRERLTSTGLEFEYE